MTRRIKFLGLALVAVLAMSSVAISAASADVLTGESFPVNLKGDQDEQIDVFKVDGGEVKCSTVSYTGTAKETKETTFTVTPTYSGCTFNGLISTIHMNGCDYLVHVNPAAGNTTGTVDIVCPVGQEITVTAPSIGVAKCIVHVGSQAGLASATATNIGAGTTRGITIDINLVGIKYNQTMGIAETGNCATADNTTNGTYTGKARITAANETTGAQVGIFLS